MEIWNVALFPMMEVELSQFGRLSEIVFRSFVHFAWMLGLQLFANSWVFRINPLKVSHF